MAVKFSECLHAAFVASKCQFKDATKECGVHIAIIAADMRGQSRMRKKNAHALAQCAVRHLNEQIAIKQAELIELRRIGEQVKALYKKEYWDEDDDAEDAEVSR